MVAICINAHITEQNLGPFSTPIRIFRLMFVDDLLTSGPTSAPKFNLHSCHLNLKRPADLGIRGRLLAVYD